VPETTWLEINADFWPNEVAPELRGPGVSPNRSLAATADATIKPGDILTIALALSATMTDDVNIYGMEIWYRSNLAFTEINSR
jgi:hypothetical protein